MGGDDKQYEMVCKARFDGLEAKMDKIHAKLFEGNGQPSLMETLAMLGTKVNLIVWVGGTITVAVITCIVGLWFRGV